MKLEMARNIFKSKIHAADHPGSYECARIMPFERALNCKDETICMHVYTFDYNINFDIYIIHLAMQPKGLWY